MYTFGGHASRLAPPLFLILMVWLLPGCDDTPVVGDRHSPDDVRIVADTIFIESTAVVSTPSFSGNRPYVTAGHYDDPVFGNIHATALMRPSISRQTGDTIVANARARVRFNIDHHYGVEGESAEFALVEVDRPWRSSSWRYDSIPNLSDRVIARFTVSGSDSVDVPIENQEWINAYRSIFLQTSATVRDSLYRANMPGLALVASGGADKLISTEMQNFRFVFEHPENDTLNLEKIASGWAVSLDTDIGPGQVTDNGVALLNTQRAMLMLDIPFTEDYLGTDMFSRLELVVYEDTLAMQAGTHPNLTRPRSETSRLFFLESDDLDFAITRDPVTQVNRRSEDQSYRFNLTNFATDRLYGSPAERRLYLSYGFNDGRVLPMLFGNTDNPDIRPRIIITRVSQEQ
ncbi:hypothetical protein QA596_05670 [Balneolales bacterium ANBcel1]|nr:hypothetical protein [Balneolales bacterium ANBcel1]